ncbi:hypothetical protein PVAP13_1KG150833 [Panicum virgatum]|uniref:Uncharacterized protein n=1 Tax=Panicum virgatum TaxID=38727 RepID=A0A8T0XJM3_PANVG|nr:hypothetical protein PVAP13_1KG150833 [Panicum virgatum]
MLPSEMSFADTVFVLLVIVVCGFTVTGVVMRWRERVHRRSDLHPRPPASSPPRPWAARPRLRLLLHAPERHLAHQLHHLLAPLLLRLLGRTTARRGGDEVHEA